MPLASTKEFENKKIFHHLLLELYLHYLHISTQTATEHKKQLEKLIILKKESPDAIESKIPAAITHYHADTKQDNSTILARQISNSTLILQNNLRAVADNIKQQIRLDKNIKDEHKVLHEQAVDYALCVDNPADLLHRMHYVHEVIYGMGRGLLQPERDAKISKYLTTMSRNIQPKFEQQIRADFNRVASKPMPKVNNLDKLHQDQVENILELAVRTAYLEHITRLINNPRLKTNSVSLVNEGCYVSRTYLNSSSFKYNNLSSRLKNNAFHPYSAWMRFFKGSESGPHTLIPTPSVKHVEKH